MSFSHEVKEELCLMPETPNASVFEISAELCGVFLFDGVINKNHLKLAFENASVIKRILKLIKKFNKHSKFKISYLQEEKLGLKKTYSIEIYAKSLEFNKYFKFENIEKCFYCDFLRGVFLCSASVSNPENEYHLEFNLNSLDLYNTLKVVFESCDLLKCTPKFTKRRKNYVAYIKDGEKITDFLTFIGASQSAIKFIQAKMIKEVRNNINRTTNFETANLSKITSSSTEQIEAIKKIQNKIGLHALPQFLQETATLRLNHPYISLKELTKFYKSPISKSGVNHRLKKIIKIAYEL